MLNNPVLRRFRASIRLAFLCDKTDDDDLAICFQEKCSPIRKQSD